MSGKLTSFVIPLGFMMLFCAAESSLAATSISAFGVMATVESGCSVSAARFPGNYRPTMANAASSVSVSCTNTTQFVITVSPLKTTGASLSVPVGKLRIPLAASAEGTLIQPLPTYVGAAYKPTAASNSNPDAISVAVIY